MTKMKFRKICVFDRSGIMYDYYEDEETCFSEKYDFKSDTLSIIQLDRNDNYSMIIETKFFKPTRFIIDFDGVNP